MKEKKYLLSVLIPTWNQVDTVITAINSVEEQNFENVEIIIVDNNPKNEYYDLLKENIPKKNNIKLFKNSTNLGMVKNWNQCIEYASGEWLGLMCSDDQYPKNTIGKILKLIDDISEPAMIIQDPSIKNEIEEFPKGVETVENLKLPLASGNFWHSSISEKIGGFDNRFEYSADAEYWYRIALHYPVFKVKAPTAIYYEHESNYMWDTWRKNNYLEQTELLIRTVVNYTNSNSERKVIKGINNTLLTVIFKSLTTQNHKDILFQYLWILIKRSLNPKLLISFIVDSISLIKNRRSNP